MIKRVRPVRSVYLYFRFISQHLKAILEYQADFVIAMAAAMLTQLLGFIFLWVVYGRIPDIQGWLFWEVAFIYAMIFFTEGFASLFFEGIWRISGLVNMGDLDRFLVRPVSPILQVLGSAVGMNGVGNLLIGGVIIFQSLQHIELDWTVGKTAFAVLLLVSAVVIRTSIYLAACSSVFWTHSPGNAFGNMMHTLSDFAKFPITIYSLGVQALIAIIVPYAFISFFPAAYIFGKSDWGPLGLLSPLVALYCAALAVWIFYRGLRKYESTGN
jgi:ABC-2 type transport system permease protein